MVCSYLALPPPPPSLYMIVLWITTTRVTFFLITWRLDTGTPDDNWTVCFVPLFVDVVCGIFLLWLTCPDRQDNYFVSSYLWTEVFNAAIVHFIVWGVQGLLIPLKLDKIISWPWYTVLSMWSLCVIMLEFRMLFLSFRIGTRCYPPLMLHSRGTMSSLSIFLAVRTTVAIILIWSWVIIGFRTWIKILVRCLWLLYV